MTTHVPLQFLVGITRLISIYFGLRSLDSVGGAVMTLGLQASVSPEVANQFPNVWAIYIPTLLVYLTLVIATWFIAPFVCRLALRSGTTEPLDVASAHKQIKGPSLYKEKGCLYHSVSFKSPHASASSQGSSQLLFRYCFLPLHL